MFKIFCNIFSQFVPLCNCQVFGFKTILVTLPQLAAKGAAAKEHRSLGWWRLNGSTWKRATNEDEKPILIKFLRNFWYHKEKFSRVLTSTYHQIVSQDRKQLFPLLPILKMRTLFVVIFGAKQDQYCHISHFEPATIPNCDKHLLKIYNLRMVCPSKMAFQWRFFWSEVYLEWKKFVKFVVVPTKYELCVGQKKKELSIPSIWDCCGSTRGSFFTHRQIKHPPFSEIAVKTHSQFGPYLVDYFACVPSDLKKGWMFYLPMGKKWMPCGSSTTPDRWY